MKQHSKSLLFFFLFCLFVEFENRKVQKLNRVEEVSGDHMDLRKRILVALILVFVLVMNILMVLMHFVVKYD